MKRTIEMGFGVPKASDVQNAQLPDTVLNRWWWRVVGKFACWWYGRLSVYPVLVSQSILETGGYTSGHFKQGKNGFGMHTPTPGASGESESSEDGGHVATYSSYWACWVDRLKWDQRHSCTEDIPKDYIKHVKDAGYSTDSQYVEKVHAIFNGLPWYTAMWGDKWEGGNYFGVPKWLVSLLTTSLFIAVMVALLWLLWKAYKLIKRNM